MASVKTLLTQTRDRVIASDPGLIRLKLAGRATFSAALALGVLFAISKFSALPITANMLGTIIALISSVVVNDKNRSQQQITALLLIPTAGISILLGTAVASSRIIADAVFVVVLFGVTYGRRFRPRGMAFGMITFISYFFSLFLNAKFSQLLWLMIGVGAGIFSAYVIRHVIFKQLQQPTRRLKSYLRAYYAEVVRVLDEIIETVTAGEEKDENHSSVRSEVVHLNETALQVVKEFNQTLSVSTQNEKKPILSLFDLELTTEQLGVASRFPLPDNQRDVTIRTLHELRLMAQQRQRNRPAIEMHEIQQIDKHAWNTALPDMARALKQAPQLGEVDGLLAEATENNLESNNSDEIDSDESTDSEDNEFLSPALRQAIQVGIAVTLAIVAGSFLSLRRWYWAALTAFIVFAGTSSRADTFKKGLQRVAGTLTGVVGGILVAFGIGGDHGIALGIIFLCIFMAFYFIQITYAVTIFWFTIALALLYSLLGRFSVDLLVLRIEETIIGAVIGIAVAVLLLSTSTRASIIDDSRDYLERLSKHIEDCACQLAGHQTDRSFISEIRALDRDFQELRTTANTLTRGMSSFFSRRNTSRWLRGLLGTRYYAMRLGRIAHHLQLNNITDSSLENVFPKAAKSINDNIQILLNEESAPPSDKGEGFNSLTIFEEYENQLKESDESFRSAARCLQHLNQLVIDLIRNFGENRS
jgi:uncharacterized membrane protein YgaE (UPF0421/DUF939 family)